MKQQRDLPHEASHANFFDSLEIVKCATCGQTCKYFMVVSYGRSKYKSGYFIKPSREASFKHVSYKSNFLIQFKIMKVASCGQNCKYFMVVSYSRSKYKSGYFIKPSREASFKHGSYKSNFFIHSKIVKCATCRQNL